MNVFIQEKNAIFSDVKMAVAAVLTLAVLFWATGMPTWLPFARAAALTDISDTLTDSDLSVVADHAFAFTTTAALDQNDTIVFLIDASTTPLFVVNNLGVSDVTLDTGLTVVAACGGGGDEVTMATTSSTVTLTVCAGDAIAPGALAITFGNGKITNPGVADSYVMRVTTTNDGGATRDTADTRVAVIDNVVVTASVDTIFDFTIAGVASAQTVNGDTTTGVSTATTLPFGTLTPGSNYILAQDLTVTTNAANGFTVTVVEDQVLTSATLATIENFIDGANTATPVAWQAPAGTLGSTDTYGHFGVTSEDADLNGDEFGSQLYAGNIDAPRAIFAHTGVADGSTANIGATRVGYQIEIDSLQEAGSDYTNTLTYVATPVF